MSELPEGTWGYARITDQSFQLWQINEGQRTEIGRIDADEGCANFICERMNDKPSELALAASRSEWQPIESFPRDEEAYLVTDNRVLGGYPQVVYWEDGRLRVPDASILYLPESFTHWQPLPAPPTR